MRQNPESGTRAAVGAKNQQENVFFQKKKREFADWKNKALDKIRREEQVLAVALLCEKKGK